MKNKYFMHALVLSAALAMSCNSNPDTASHSLLDPEGRAIAGRPLPYHADKVEAKTVNTNFAKRRELGWDIVRKVFKEQQLDLLDGKSIFIPGFLTWYERQEIMPLAQTLVEKHGIPATNQGGFAREAIDSVLQSQPRQAPQVDATASTNPEVSAPAQAFFHGQGGTYFSQSFVTHILENTNGILNCKINIEDDLLSLKAAGKVKSFTPCMDEFPIDAVMTKGSFQPVIQGLVQRQATADTSAPSLAKIFSRSPTQSYMDILNLQDNTPQDPRRYYTVTDRFGGVQALESLHIVTKEIDEWVWVTLWWSADGSQDFGADRPLDLLGKLGNYKMLVQTSFIEQDPDPTANIKDPSLKAAVEVLTSAEGSLRTPAGTAMFSANPYIEGGFPQKTCIGCHQSAGHPDGGFGERSERIHNQFPADFSFALSSMKRMLRSISPRPGVQDPSAEVPPSTNTVPETSSDIGFVSSDSDGTDDQARD